MRARVPSLCTMQASERAPEKSIVAPGEPEDLSRGFRFTRSDEYDVVGCWVEAEGAGNGSAGSCTVGSRADDDASGGSLSSRLESVGIGRMAVGGPTP